MAKKSRTSVLKRQRELRKAERAAHKREKRQQPRGESSGVATRDDLEGYGFASEPRREDGER